MNRRQLGLVKQALERGRSMGLPLSQLSHHPDGLLGKSAAWSDWGRWGLEMGGSILGGVGGAIGGSFVGTPGVGTTVGGIGGSILGGEVGKGLGNWAFGAPRPTPAEAEPPQPRPTVTSGAPAYPNYMAPPGQGGTSNRYMPSTTLPPGGLPQYGGYPGGIFGSSTPPSPGAGTSLLPGTLKSSSVTGLLKWAMSRWRRPEHLAAVNRRVKQDAMSHGLSNLAARQKAALPQAEHSRVPIPLFPAPGGTALEAVNVDMTGPLFSFRNQAAVKAWQDSLRQARYGVTTVDPRRGKLTNKAEPLYNARSVKQKKRSTAALLSGGTTGVGNVGALFTGQSRPAHSALINKAIRTNTDPLYASSTLPTGDSGSFINRLRSTVESGRYPFPPAQDPNAHQVLRERLNAMLERQARLGVQNNQALAPGFEALHRRLGRLPA